MEETRAASPGCCSSSAAAEACEFEIHRRAVLAAWWNCGAVGIRYEHLPELGIAFEKRKKLAGLRDRNRSLAPAITGKVVPLLGLRLPLSVAPRALGTVTCGAPSMTAIQILPLSHQHFVAAAQALADGFADKEPFVWLVPDRKRRAAIMPVFFESTLRYSHPPGRGSEVALVGSEVAGCAIWAPPGDAGSGLWSELASAWFLLRRIGWRDLGTLGRRGQVLQRALLAVRPIEPHWYLVGMGAASRWQGNGIGTALLSSGLRRCDVGGHAAYLECLEPLIPYYERFGFVRHHRVVLPNGTPPQMGLWRDAIATR
jgi:GNAT superfamily N-acetyltransferase